MREQKKSVYYCDHCKKHTLTKQSMEKHERRCTSNPDRECAMCKHCEGGSVGAGKLKEMALAGATIDELREAAGGCPICILAGIKQSGAMKMWEDDPLHESVRGWNFKKELSELWAEINSHAELQEYRSYYGY